eukprot:296239-Amorphochlora_amoeboformis.AAC.2
MMPPVSTAESFDSRSLRSCGDFLQSIAEAVGIPAQAPQFTVSRRVVTVWENESLSRHVSIRPVVEVGGGGGGLGVRRIVMTCQHFRLGTGFRGILSFLFHLSFSSTCLAFSLSANVQIEKKGRSQEGREGVPVAY